MWGSLDGSVESWPVPEAEAWKDREAKAAAAALAAEEEQKKAATRTWGDTARDVAGFPARLFGALSSPSMEAPKEAPATGNRLDQARQAFSQPGVQNIIPNLGKAVGDAVVSGATLPGDVAAGRLGVMGPDGQTNPEVIRRAFDTASLAGGGAVGGAASRAVPQLAADTMKSGAPLATAAHAPAFYSTLDEVAAAAKMNRAPGAQWDATLRNAGVKPEELDYRGVTKLLAERRAQPITKEELQAHLQANPVPEIKPVDKLPAPEWSKLTGNQQYEIERAWQDQGGKSSYYVDPIHYYDEKIRPDFDEASSFGVGGARWGEYQLNKGEGGSNYRERLLTLPEQEAKFGIFRGDEMLSPETFSSGKAAREFVAGSPNYGDFNGATVRQVNDPPPTYKSDHWGEPNPIVHRRSTDREFPQAFTPEEEAAIVAREAARGELNGVRQQQNVVSREIVQTAKPLESARQAQIWDDVGAGKISRAEGIRRIEEFVDHPELKPLQDKLQALRAQEDAITNGLPPEPQPRSTRSLHAEEIQSDWHQAGRKQGYQSEAMKALEAEAEARKAFRDGVKNDMPDDQLDVLRQQLADASRASMKYSTVVPDAPFKKTWHELAVKDMLREAAEGDYGRISWTAGAAQPTNPKNLLRGVTKPEYEATSNGLQGFYDKIMVDYVNKLGKKYGVKVERGSLPDKDGISGEKAMDRMGIPREQQADFWDDLVNNKPHGAREKFLEEAQKRGHDVFYMDVPKAMKDDILSRGFAMFEDASAAGQPISALERLGGQNVEGSAGTGAGRGVGGGARSMEEAQAAAARYAGTIKPLEGLPSKPLTVGGEPYIPGPIASVHDIAKSYMEGAGRPYVRADRYHPIDEAKSSSIAKAFDEMKHAPDDPRVRASYDAMIKETADQYDAAVKSGVKFEPIPPGMADPYAETPRLAAKDVQENNHLWYFPTEQGFGTGVQGGIDMSKHPMMGKSGRKDIHGNEMLNNDLFRVVHDYFGHLKEGYGFRAAGEDNAWRTHANMYSDAAKPAMTTETRGQNSWVNYGPHGEKNRTASSSDTVYADQKVGLLPDWVWKDELAPAAPAIAQGRSRFVDDQGLAIPGAGYTKEAQSIKKEIAAGPKGEGPIDLSTQGQTPGVEQRPLERNVPARGIPARMQDAMANPEVAAGLEESMRKGTGVGNWYHTEPLRQEFMRVLGDEGEAAFKQYMDLVAATSPRSDVPTNIRNASYYYSGGDPAKTNPYPYGHVAQNLHKQNVATVGSEAGWNPLQNPKPASFAENLRGNLEPVTVDTHAFRNIAMRTKDPRFLETSYHQKIDKGREPGPDSLVARFAEVKTSAKGEKIATFRPQQLVKDGKITIEEAQKIPSFWASKPRDGEYAAAESLFRQAGDKVGMRPADAQAAAWSGAGEMTGLGTVGTHTFNELMNEQIMFTAKMRGEKPEKVLRDFIAKGKPLLSDTMPGMAFGSLDGREEKR